jgi:hypothetical protein
VKWFLKLIIVLVIVLATLFATTPLWFPNLVENRLPDGWLLEEIDFDYPGASGVDVNTLRLKVYQNHIPVTLTARGIHLGFRQLDTRISSLTADVHLAESSGDSGAITLDDFSLPVIEPPRFLSLPRFTIGQLSLNLHFGADRVIRSTFSELTVEPNADGGLHLAAMVGLDLGSDLHGRMVIDTQHDGFSASFRVPDNDPILNFLNVHIEQTGYPSHTKTRILADLDTSVIEPRWFESFLSPNTAGVPDHLTGRLQLQAAFSGKTSQHIDQVRLASDSLTLESENFRLEISAGLLAVQEDGKVDVSLSDPAHILYQSQPIEGSSLISLPGIKYTGEVEQNLNLRMTDLQLSHSVPPDPDSTSVRAQIDLSWQEATAFSYTTMDLEVAAESMSLSTSGTVSIEQQVIAFEQTGDLSLELDNLKVKLAADPLQLGLESGHFAMLGRLQTEFSLSDPEKSVQYLYKGPVKFHTPMIRLTTDDSNPPTVLEADEWFMDAEIRAQNGELVSTGSGSALQTRLSPQNASAEKLEMQWQQLDLFAMTGVLGTRAEGFGVTLDGENWSGFDLGATYTLSPNSVVEGSATIDFENGPSLPLNFKGNLAQEQWDITLPPNIFPLAQLPVLLQAGHVEVPEMIEWNSGSVEISGRIEIDDEMRAAIMIEGHEMALAMQQSKASGGNIGLDALYAGHLEANGLVSVEKIALAGGLEVLQLSTDLDLDLEGREIIGLNNIQAKLLGGQLNLASLRLVQDRIEDTVVDLTGIDLSRLLAYVDIDGLDGSGTLDISLPLGSDAEGVYVKQGTFGSTIPGHLVYINSNVAGDTPMTTNIGLQALENFQYQELSGTVDYRSDGSYEIVVRLEGSNPNLYEGYPIVFTLNIDGSLPELFEALFVSGDFEEAILEQIRSR